MARTSYHDVIVVGTDIAGLLAGSWLCRQNYRVLLIGQGGPRGGYDHEGVQVPALPTMLPPYGFAPVFDQVLGALGLEDPVHTLGIKNQPALQIVTPEQRVDLSLDAANLDRELQRDFPNDKDQILSLLATFRNLDKRLEETLAACPSLPPKGIRQRARLKRLTLSLDNEQLPDPAEWPLLLRILLAATGFICHLDTQARTPSVNGHLMVMLLAGMRTVSDLSNPLIEALHKAGADLELSTVAEEILFAGREVSGIKALGNPNTYNCASLIVNLPIMQALEMVPLDRKHRRFRLEAESVRRSQSVFAINLVLPKEAIPSGMGPHVILVRNPGEPLQEDNLIRMHSHPFPGREGRLLLNLSCIIPFRERVVGREYLVPLQQRMLQTAAWLIPFIEENIEGRSSPFWESRAPDEGQASPWELYPIIEADHRAVLGSVILPARTPYANLFFSGLEVAPGLGTEGAAFSAMQTIRLIAERIKLKKIL